MSIEEAIKELESLSPSESAINIVLHHLKFYKEGLEREIESNRKNISEIIEKDRMIDRLIMNLKQSMKDNIEMVKHFERLIQGTEEDTHDRRSWLRRKTIALTNYEFARDILKSLEVQNAKE